MILKKINEIKPNPNNPRVIKDHNFNKLVKSIQEFPEMLKLRPIVVDNDGIVLGGNMRLKACIEVGLEEIPVLVASELTPEQQKEFIIKDNSNFGDWDWEVLQTDWDLGQLGEWVVDIPHFEDNLTNNENYDGLDQASKLDKFLTSELKRMFLVYDNETFQKVVDWFNTKQEVLNLENHSQVILKIIENENI